MRRARVVRQVAAVRHRAGTALVVAGMASLLGLSACERAAVQWEAEAGSGGALGGALGGVLGGALGDRLALELGADGTPALVGTWTPPSAPTGVSSCPGSLVAALARGDTAYAAWWAPRVDSSAQLVVARSNDGGRSWRAPVVADSVDRARTGCRREPPALAVSSRDGDVHVAYFLVAPEGPGVFVVHSMEGGAMFHAPVPVVYGERPSSAAVASSDSVVAVAFLDPNASAPQVWLALSRSKGHIFERRASVSSRNASASQPAVALRGGRIAVAWRETAHGGGAATTVIRTGLLTW